MAFISIIHPPIFAFLVTLFSIIPVYLTHEGVDRFFKDVNVLENCPVNSRCVAIERCPHLYRTLTENPDGSLLYISCNIAKSLMAIPALGVCCNHHFLGENLGYTENPDIDLDMLDDLDIVGEESINTDDFTRTIRGATEQNTQTHTQTHSTPSHSSTPETLHHTPTHYNLHRKTEEAGGGSANYYNGLKPEELAYLLENQGYNEGFGDDPEYYASAVDKDSHYDPNPSYPPKTEEYVERDIPEIISPGSQPNYFPYFMPHVEAYNIMSQFPIRGFPGRPNNKEHGRTFYEEKPHSAVEMGEGVTTERSDLIFKREEPASNHPDYEDNYCPLKCRGPPGLPGPIGPRGFPGPPGPPGPPGRVIYVNVPASTSTTAEDSSSKHSSSLSEVSSYSKDYNADDPVQIQTYESTDVNPNQHSNSDISTHNDKYNSFQNSRRYNRNYGRIAYNPLPYNREPQKRAHVSKRNRRSTETPKISHPNVMINSELKQLISQLIKEYINNN